MTKKIGTLAEIGAKAGDVVECVGNTGADGSLQLGREYEVAQSGLVIDEQGDEYDWITPKFRIISRAKPQGPVITETVTRKRIVPGVYGKVSIVSSNDAETVWVCVEETDMSRADLIAARDVFNQLIDALE